MQWHLHVLHLPKLPEICYIVHVLHYKNLLVFSFENASNSVKYKLEIVAFMGTSQLTVGNVF